MSSAELGRLPAGCCLYHPTHPAADPAEKLPASFHPCPRGISAGQKRVVCVVALQKVSVTLKRCFFLCVPEPLQTVLFGNVNEMQSLVQRCPVFRTSCHFCRTTLLQHMKVKDLGHQGQASVQGDELGFFGRALR